MSVSISAFTRELAIALCMIVVLFLLSTHQYHDLNFLPHFTADEVYPLRSMWFFEETVAQKEHVKYQDSRLSGILPGFVFFRLLPLELANQLLHFWFFLLCLLGVFLLARQFNEFSVSLLLLAFVGVWQKFLWYNGVIYSASTGWGYLLLAVAMAGYAYRTFDQGRKRDFMLVTSGVLSGLLVHSHASWLVFGLPTVGIAFIYFFCIRCMKEATNNHDRILGFIRDGSLIAVGMLSQTLFFCLSSFFYGGPFLFFYKSLQIIIDSPYKDAVFFKQSAFPFFLGEAWWLFVPGAAFFASLGIVGAIVGDVRAYKNPIWGLAFLLILYILFASYQWMYTSVNYLSKPDTLVFLFPTTLMLFVGMLSKIPSKVQKLGVTLVLGALAGLKYEVFNGFQRLGEVGDFAQFKFLIVLLLLILTFAGIRYRSLILTLCSVLLLSEVSELPFVGLSPDSSLVLAAILFLTGFFVLAKENAGHRWTSAASFGFVMVLSLDPPLEGDRQLFHQLHDLANSVVSLSDIERPVLWYSRSNGKNGQLLNGVSNLLPKQYKHYEQFPTFSSSTIWEKSLDEISPIPGETLLISRSVEDGSWLDNANESLANFGLTLAAMTRTIPYQIESNQMELISVEVLSIEPEYGVVIGLEGKQFGEAVEPVRIPLPEKTKLLSLSNFKISALLKPNLLSPIPFAGFSDESPAMPLMVGPLIVFATDRDEIYRVILANIESRPAELFVRLPNEEWSLLELDYGNGSLSFRKNGRLVKSVEASPDFPSSVVTIGGGFLDRRWSGRIAIVEMVKWSGDSRNASGEVEVIKWESER
ncbi:MAG: hypothetical protein ACFHX7_06200 [Pseudomonadota bacterium]